MQLKTIHQRKRKCFLLVLLLSVVGITKGYAYRFSAVCSTGQTLYYNITNSTNRYVELTYPGSSYWDGWSGYNKPTGNLVIPGTVQYSGRTYTVTSIGAHAFYSCYGLTSVVISNSVTTINEEAFYVCNGLTSVTIGSSVTSIGNYAFSGCSNLEQITVASNNTHFDSRGNCNAIIETATNKLVLGCKNTVIPNSVTSIGDNAFYSCYGLSSIEIPNSVTSIGSNAFSGCYELTSIELPNSIISIGDGAFTFCDSLTSIEIPVSVSSIGEMVFSGCSSLEQIVVASNNAYYDSRENCNAIIETSTNTLLAGCKNTIIPNSVSALGNGAFNDCNGLTSIEIPNSVTSIGDMVFSYCMGLTSIVFSNSLTSIGNDAFGGCSNLTSIELPNTLTTIGYYAFEHCSSLASVELPNSLTVIGDGAFEGCGGMTSITIGNSVDSIGGYAFGYCGSLSSITVLAETPPVLGDNVFLGVHPIPVYVPCSALGNYHAASDWSSYTNLNILGLCQGEVTVTVKPSEGGTVTGAGIFYGGEICTLVATPNEGNSFCSWTENDSVVSYNSTYSFVVAGDRNLVANFGNCPEVAIGIDGTATNAYLPSYTSYNYSLSQQIYLADEIGKSGSISSVAFYNGGYTNTREFDIYLVSTEKTSFESTTDWIATTEDDLVYSGSVTLEADRWTFIGFDTIFVYDTTTNLALIVDDNTGAYSIYNMACRVFSTDSSQAIRTFSGSTNYDPNNPTQYFYGTLQTIKNQVILGFDIVTETNLSDEICYGEDYLENGFEIYNPEVGEHEYSITLPSLQYTDSIVNLTLTVYPTYYFVEDTTLCNATSYTWRGHTYTESGIYYDSLQTIYGCDSIYALSLEFFNTPLGEFTYMTPTNNYPFTSLPITFSWDAVSGAEYYDLYVWDVDEQMPEDPFVSGLRYGSYSTSALQNYHTYNWFVIARNACYEMSSSVKSFYLDITPSLNVNVNHIDFGEEAMNQSTSTTLNVTGIVLEDELDVQITGEDAAMFSFTQASGWNEYNGGILIVTFNPTTPQYSYNANLVVSSGTLTKTVSLVGTVSNLYTFNTHVAEDVYAMNSQIPIYGSVIDWNSNPVSDAEVEIGIFVMGMKRTLQAVTDESGQFSAVFEPMPSESGYYTVNSGRVGNHSTAVHDDFNIPGMTLVSSDYILCAVTQDQPRMDSILIRNKSNLNLSNIQVSPISVPDGALFSFMPLSLGGLEENWLIYTVTGSTLTQGNYYEEAKLKATSSEGAEMNISIWYYCMEPRGVLDVMPKSLATTMTKGKSKIVDVMLTNNGTAATGNITIDLPDVEWVSVVGNDTLSSIAVNDTAYFSLRFSPAVDIQLGQYSGTIAINSERGDAVALPYTITAVSDSTGTLMIDVTDDFTWNTNNGNGPHLEGAEVTLKGYYSLETVAYGFTDADGHFSVEDLPEGYYRLSVTAERHTDYNSVVFVEAGATGRSYTDVYLQYQAITYSWNVVPTEIWDEYTYEFEVTFETNVPVPVVVIETPDSIPTFEESYSFNYVITNHGLIDALDMTLHVPISDDLLFTPLCDHVDTLHALTTIVIPCVVTQKETRTSTLKSDCAEWGYTWSEYSYKCHKIDGSLEVKHSSGFVYTLLGRKPCNPPTGGNGDTGGFAAPLLGIVGGHGGGAFPNPFFTSPLLEMWYECDNGCVNMVFWGIDKLLSSITGFKWIYIGAKVVYNVATIMEQDVKDALLSVYDFYNYVADMANALSKDVPPMVKFMKMAKEVKTVKQNIIHCYHYLNGTANKEYELGLEYVDVPDEVAEMLQYMDEYASAITNMVDVLNMYYSDTTWFYSDINELDGFMNMVFEYDSIYGRVYADSILLSHKPSNINNEQVISFVDRYNNTVDIYNGIVINSDNYIPIDSINSTLLPILNIENEAILLGFESGADRIMHLIDEAYDYLEENKSSSVCAKVMVQFSQKMTMTREAFDGTLTIHNGHDTDPMEAINVNFIIKDEDANDCTNLFQINTMSLNNITGIDGSGSLDAGLDGIAKIQFIPTKYAAPTEPKVYYFGGTFSFIDPYTLDEIVYDLYPVEITVNPSPDLYVDYFMQRDILGDDAMTEDIVEPSIPAELGVIIHNQGAGMAKNVLLETAEPQIVDNEKGLAIDFAMYGASFNGSPRQLGLMGISFGNIESGQTAVGEWLFTSSLLGHFISYEAHVIHNSSYGNSDLSLVSHLDIHELIHPIYAYGNLDDGINDFLVNDNPDAYDTPDSIYFSHGGKTSVSVVDDISFDHLVSPSDTIVTLTVEPSRVGWNYGVTDDPGMNQYNIVSCIRNNDNQEIPLNNVWLTFVTIPDGGDPVYENKLHVVDTIPVQQTTTYTLVFAKKPSNLRIFHGNEDEYWSNVANWEDYILPQADDEVLINGICQLDEDAEVFSLTIAENQSLTIPAGRILTVSGQLTSASVSRLIIEEGGQLMHSNAGAQGTVQKNILPYTEGTRDGWYLVASPLVGNTAVTSVANMLNNNYDLYYYDEPTHYWMNQEYAANNFTELTNGKGYLYANNEEVMLGFEGELQSGSAIITVLLNYTDGIDLAGFNLVGNPYAHNVTSYSSANVANGCFQINETKDDFIVSEISEANPLKPAEGFFVKAVDEGASITFNSGRGTTANHNGSIYVELLYDSKLIDRLIVKSEGDPLRKFSLNNGRAKVFAMLDHREVAIVPCEGNEQPVNLKAAKNGTFTINVNVNNLEFDYLHLIDNLTGADVDLLALRQAQGPMSYTFEAKTTDYDSRFKLVFFVRGDENDEDAPFAFINNGNIIIVGAEADATLQIVDVVGHVIHSGDAMNRVSTSGMSPGVYVLRLINGEEVKTQKIVIE